MSNICSCLWPRRWLDRKFLSVKWMITKGMTDGRSFIANLASSGSHDWKASRRTHRRRAWKTWRFGSVRNGNETRSKIEEDNRSWQSLEINSSKSNTSKALSKTISSGNPYDTALSGIGEFELATTESFTASIWPDTRLLSFWSKSQLRERIFESIKVFSIFYIDIRFPRKTLQFFGSRIWNNCDWLSWLASPHGRREGKTKASLATIALTWPADR